MMPFVYQYQPYPSHAYAALPSPTPSYSSKNQRVINSPHYYTTSPFEKTRTINKINVPSLPPIQHIVLPPLSPSNNSTPSPNSTFLSFSSNSPSPQQPNGSIQSLLNSDPELKRLDEEEYKYGYQSHFMNSAVKRKIPSPAHSLNATKKPKPYSNKKVTPFIPSAFTSPSPSIKGGLRHFSKQVCEKVKAHGITTYDQVVHEITCDLSSSSFHWFDEKNIRRRVYDSLNVLMAMDIIAKVKKEIKWLGIPSCYQHDDSGDMDIGKTMDLLLDTDDSFYVQQIRIEEARKKALLSSISITRIDIRNSLTKYLQLRRLIHRNQHDPLAPSRMDDSYSKSLDYSTIGNSHILSSQFNYPFTTQEISAWLPDSSWYHYIDLNAS